MLSLQNNKPTFLWSFIWSSQRCTFLQRLCLGCRLESVLVEMIVVQISPIQYLFDKANLQLFPVAVHLYSLIPVPNHFPNSWFQIYPQDSLQNDSFEIFLSDKACRKTLLQLINDISVKYIWSNSFDHPDVASLKSSWFTSVLLKGKSSWKGSCEMQIAQAEWNNLVENLHRRLWCGK